MAEALGDALLSLRTDDSELDAGLERARRKVEKATNDLAAAQARATATNSEAKAAYKAGEITLEAYNKKLIETKAALRQFEVGHQAARKEMAGFTQSGQSIVASAGAQRAGMQQLSMQLNDAATMFALGARPMQIFASQGGQVIQAMQLMTNGGRGLVGFLAGPWGMALTTATIVLVPLISNLLETEDAMGKVEFASDAMADAQGILGSVIDLTTGKIKEQSQAIIALTVAKMRSAEIDARARRDVARNEMISIRKGRVQLQGGMGGGLRFERVGDATADVVSAFQDGTLSALEAQRGLDSLLQSKLITEKQFQRAAAAMANFAMEDANVAIYSDANKALSGDQSALQQFLTPGKDKKPKTPKGPDAAKIEARFNDELASLTDRTLSAMERQATNAEDEAEYRLRGVELARIRTLADIEANADYDKVQKHRLKQQVEELAEWERKAVELDKQARLEREQSLLADDRHRAAMDDLRLQADMADTQQDRKRIALEMFELEERYQRSLLEAVIASETAPAEEKKRAKEMLDRRIASADARRAGVAHANATDVERFLDNINKTPEQMNEAIDSIKIDGLEAFNDGLVDAIVNFRSLGDVARTVLAQILSDLLRLQIQKAIIGPLAGMLGLSGGAAPNASLAGGITSMMDSPAFAGLFASGGLIPHGSFGIVGEAGPEPVFATAGGVGVLPNSAIRRVDGGGERGGDTFISNYNIPERADPRTTRSAAARGTQMAIARATRKGLAR